jgi:hypothetical protein
VRLRENEEGVQVWRVILLYYYITRIRGPAAKYTYSGVFAYLLTYYSSDSTDNDEDDDSTPLMETTIRLVARAIFIRHPL